MSRLDFYSIEDLEKIIIRSASILNIDISKEAAREICEPFQRHAQDSQPNTKEG